jgi:hypothetical protein
MSEWMNEVLDTNETRPMPRGGVGGWRFLKNVTHMGGGLKWPKNITHII